MSGAPFTSPPVVYFDMNVWVSMTRGCQQGDPRWVDAREELIRAIAKRRAVILLSSANYLELWHRLDQRSREEVGAQMRDVSGYTTLESTHLVRRREVRNHIHRFTGETSERVTTREVVGHGAAHAFGSRHGRFRFVESLASADGLRTEGAATTPPDGWNLLARGGGSWEWLQLVGTQALLESEGVDRTPEHRYGTHQQQEELNLREQLRVEPETRRRLWDFLVAHEIISLLDEINECCEELQIDPRALFFGPATRMTPPEAIHALIEDLPSAYTWARLRYWKHRDLTHPWEQHDWTDISSLSVAVPYCDIIVTERRWTHLIKAAGLAERYDTNVGHGLTAIESLLLRIS